MVSHSRSLYTSSAYLLVACTGILLCHDRSLAEPQNGIGAALKAWRTQESLVQSATFSWTESQTHSRGEVSNSHGAAGRLPPGAIIPPADVTYSVPKTLAFDHDKLRYTYEGKHWSPHTNGLVSDPYVSVFDGAISKIFQPPGAMPHPTGYVRPEKRNVDSQNLHTRPLLMRYRPFHPVMGISKLTEFTLSAQPAMRGEGTYVALEHNDVATGTGRMIWADPEKGFAIVHYATSRRGQAAVTTDIEYARNPSHEWVPSSWTIVQIDHAGMITQSFSAKVSTYDINPVIPVTAFQVVFPPGTRVSDMKDNVEYIVKDNDTKRLIPPEDIGATYDQLLNSAPGAARHTTTHGSRTLWWVIGSISAFLAISASWIWWRRHGA